MNAAQKKLKKRLKFNPKESYCPYIPPEWDPKLFTKSTGEIHDYIMDRFEAACDEVEYYAALRYLITPSAKHDDLLIEWHDSPQYAALIKSIEKENAKTTPKSLRKTTKKTKITKKSKEMSQESEDNIDNRQVIVKKDEVIVKEPVLKKSVKKTKIVQTKL